MSPNSSSEFGDFEAHLVPDLVDGVPLEAGAHSLARDFLGFHEGGLGAGHVFEQPARRFRVEAGGAQLFGVLGGLLGAFVGLHDVPEGLDVVGVFHGRYV